MFGMLVEMHCAEIDFDICQGCGARLAGSNIRIATPSQAKAEVISFFGMPYLPDKSDTTAVLSFSLYQDGLSGHQYPGSTPGDDVAIDCSPHFWEGVVGEHACVSAAKVSIP
ncbi:hypothetical protein MDA_GLEAN10013428 [Myotis davidii]|uniref:Uncharacterized protein n=1 Tax=Myotis davidii TaxID=225400 RepID=L5LZ15_MYODS|nr:hypothetical protein MDA_GLEAN10013428 [Myotis davidii]